MSETKKGIHEKNEPSSKICDNDDETLSKEKAGPLSEFLRNNRDALKGMTEEEFTAAYNEAQMKSTSEKKATDFGSTRTNTSEEKAMMGMEVSNSVLTGTGRHSFDKTLSMKDNMININTRERLYSIVLKFTTLSETNTEAPCFTINEKGATVGKDETNGVCVPSDARLAAEAHATFVNEDGIFYLVDGGHDSAASLRIGMGINSSRKWEILPNCRFSAGNTIFHSDGIDNEGKLLLRIVDGPLKGESRVIGEEGASIGRSSENSIAIPDRELSRRHSKVFYDKETELFYIGDVGSTNGTYVQLVGPYGGRYRLHIDDHILIGRTGFSINRFDYGISEEVGTRPAMEDACTIVQHLAISGLETAQGGECLFPQSFFGVYDGHNGAEASAFLSRTLDAKVGSFIGEIAPAVCSLLAEEEKTEGPARKEAVEATDKLIVEAIKDAFIATDDEFINESGFAQHGSTATTVLLLGSRLYCANTGDSRTMICRNFSAIPLTTDHKPSREDELQRIRAAGGFVMRGRVMAELAVSRAFGDVDYKRGIQSIIDEGETSHSASESNSESQQEWDKPLIIADPEIETLQIRNTDQFLLLACDGLFDVFSYDEVVEFVRAQMESHGDAQLCCQNITFEAIRKRNSRDNVSVILVILNKWW